MRFVIKSLGVFVLFYLLCSCGILKKQNNYLSGIRIPETYKTIELLENVEFKQVRGAIKTEYYAFAGKGIYSHILETDSGSYFHADFPEFICEDYDLGGVFLTKEETPRLLIWTSIADEKKFLLKITNPKYVKRLEKQTNSRRPFVHSYYEISSDNYTIK